jgi:hypothetical protein
MTDKLEDHDDIIEIFVDYKKGFYSRQNAIRQLVKRGFEPHLAEAMLSAMRKDNVVAIRGHDKRSEATRNGYNKWLETTRGCKKGPSRVETDNKS